eukprot:COSAG01_NODE_3292_length_6306_cov_4.265635_3_plen_55_part_00
MVLDAFQDNPSQTQLEVQLMNNRAAHGVVSGSKEVCAPGLQSEAVCLRGGGRSF